MRNEPRPPTSRLPHSAPRCWSGGRHRKRRSMPKRVDHAGAVRQDRPPHHHHLGLLRRVRSFLHWLRPYIATTTITRLPPVPFCLPTYATKACACATVCTGTIESGSGDRRRFSLSPSHTTSPNPSSEADISIDAITTKSITHPFLSRTWRP